MRLFLFAFLCVSSFVSWGQQAIIRHNTVILENEELFRIFSTGSFSHQTFKVKNLQEEDLILVDQTTLRNDQGTLLMKLIFMNMPQAEAYIPMSINFKKHLARLLVSYNVIEKNVLNQQGVALFCKNYNISNYPSKYIPEDVAGVKEKKRVPRERERERKPVPVPEPVKEEVQETPQENTEAQEAETMDENGNIKRDLTQQIYLSGSKIRQDSKEIGTYSSEKKMLLGQEGKQITIFAYNGSKLAIARFIDGDEQCELRTLNDNKTWNIPIPKGDIYTIVKDIVRVLADRKYM